MNLDDDDTRVAPAPAPISPRRIGSVLMIFLIGFAFVSVKTLWLQSVQNKSYSIEANTQQVDTETIPAVRGEIVDRNGQPLAVGEEAVTFWADPKIIKDPVGTAFKVAGLLNMTTPQEADLLQRLSDKSLGFVYVDRQVPNAQAQALANANIVGIGHYDEPHRLYPLGSVGGQILGGVNTDNAGIAGLELYYNKELSGTPGKSVIVRDPTGTPVDMLSLQQEQDGRRVRLTIDSTIQTEVERILASSTKAVHGTDASAIVMNPRTGEIYAMANVPAIDPNKFATSKVDTQRNRALTDVYEPGSVFKVVTIGGALEEGIITPSTSFEVPNVLQVADRKIHDAENHGPERLSVQQILIQSSNIGTVKIAEMFGAKNVSAWISRFGFGHLTGIDYPGESNGIVPSLSEWSGSSIGNIPIGQGVAVTPLQIAAAYSAIANDGVMVQPHLLKGLSGEPPLVYPKRRVLQPSTAATLRGILSQVVSAEDGTGISARIADYKVAGKTGTAQIASKGGYLKGVYNASFVGMVPADNPQLVVFVVIHHTTQFGGSASAPAFKKITQFALQYLAIPPDGVE